MTLAIKKFGAGEPETLTEFAKLHGLKIEVTERSRTRWSDLGRYYASFTCPDKCVETVSRGGFLSDFGSGSTPDEAAADYARKLAGKCLVIGAKRLDERRIDIPNDFHHEPEQ
jgi:hypothetical protein